MKILLFGNSFWSMYKFRGNLIKNFLEFGNIVYVISPNNDETIPYIKIKGVIDIKVNLKSKSKNILTELRSIIDIRKIINQINPDICILYTIKPIVYSLIVKNSKIKYISVIPGLGSMFKKGYLKVIFNNIYKLILDRSNKIIVLNEFDKNYIKNIVRNKNKIILIPGEGIDDKYYSFNINNKKIQRFIYIGRLIKEKGIEDYLDSAIIVKNIYKEIEMAILGPLDRLSIKKLGKKYNDIINNKKYINYLGVDKDSKNILSKYDAIVLPTYYNEGLPMVILEAASMGKLVLTTNNRGCNEIIKNNITGIHINKKDPKNIADTIIKIYEGKYRNVDSIIKAARSEIEDKYSSDIIVSVYNDIIKKLYDENLHN
ncbi:MAG: glycosyltransferase family 4 protein [Candidatus Zixiibacteriota bacterium]